MKVLHIACLAPPEVGGIGQVAWREVTDLRAHGIDARLIVPELPETHFAQRKLGDYERSFVHRLKTLWRFGNASALSDWLNLAKTADVLHVHYPYYGFLEQLWWHRHELPPVVFTYHMDATAKGIKGLIFALHRLLLQSLECSIAKKIFVSSFDYARESSIAKRFRAYPDQFIELPFGLDTDHYSPGAAQKQRLGLLPDDPTILFVGGLDDAHAFKGLDVLLESLKLLDPATKLIVVGDGNLKSVYEEQARAHGLSSRVLFMGRVPAEEMVPLYRSADVFAFPSVSKAEAFGLVALEAQACGIPVVASDLPGVRTVVRHQETGLLVPPKDVNALAQALTTLLSNTTLRQRYSDQARKHALSYGFAAHTQALIDTYKRVCE